MNISEFQSAQSSLLKRLLIDSREDLEKYLEAVITKKGHAWCMDVKNERRKIARLIVSALDQVYELR